MSYTITLTDGTVLCTIASQTLDTSHTSLTLWGQGEANYGQILMNDMVNMTENFANTTAPPNPLVGQLWYSTAYQIFNVWNGTAWVALRPDAPPNDAGIAPIIVGSSPSIACLLSNGQVIATVSNTSIIQSSLPTDVNYRNNSYLLSTNFPYGIGPGITIGSGFELSPTDNSDTLVTSKWVKQQGYVTSGSLGPTGPTGPTGASGTTGPTGAAGGVLSVATYTGTVTLANLITAGVAPLNSPIFTSGVTLGGDAGPTMTTGSGAPSGVQPNSSLYLNTTGTTGSRLYVSNGSTWSSIAGV